MRAGRPNLLILMPDQMRSDCMGCAGHPVIRTPNLDRLAAEGARFTQACTSSPLCMPARACFMSGRYPHNHGMWRNHGRLPADYESVFRRLRDAGYRTCHVGKSHYYEHRGQHLSGEEPYMHARGFDDLHETTGPWATVTTDSYMTDRWAELGLLDAFREDYHRRRESQEVAVWPSPLPEEEFMDSYVGRVAVEYLESYAADRPFCLFMGFGGPHEPWDAPGRYATIYDPSLMPPVIPAGSPGDWLPEHVRDSFARSRRAGLGERKVGEIRGSYFGKISLIDHWVGRILEVLDARGWAEDTLVLLWSDHGEMLGDHQRLHKSVFLESALRVPLVLRWPGHVEAGVTRDALASTVDCFPTLLEAAGLEPDEGCQGVSLWPAVGDPAAEVRDAVFSEIAPAPLGSLMVRTREWKYAVDRQARPVLLYDLCHDPTEQRNLVGHPDHTDVEAELRDRLLGFLAGAQPML